MVKLGQLVKDKISGFEGIVVSKCTWLYGCVRVGVTSQTSLTKDGEPVNLTFDEPSLKVIKIKKQKIKPKIEYTGGDRNYNSQRKDITR